MTGVGDSELVFSKIYREAVWGADGGGSGRGSTPENARRTVEILHHILDQRSLHSLLDAPCGAMEWTAAFIEDRRARDPHFTYTGVDVVAEVVEANRAAFEPAVARFAQIDLVRETPPADCQLILCRDTLQHLSYDAIAGVLDGFTKTSARYLLTTSFSQKGEAASGSNADIEVGRFFRVDLLDEPFGFQTGLLELHDDNRPSGFQTGQKLLLYDLPALAGSAEFSAFVDPRVDRR